VVSLPGLPVAVIAPGIELDHEALTRPVAVDEEALDEDVRGWERDVAGSAKLEEERLEWGADVVRLVQTREHEVELAHPAVAAAAPADRLERAHAKKPQPIRLLGCPVKGALICDRGEIQQRAWDRGERDAKVDVTVFAGELARSVDRDPWLPVTPPTRSCDVDRTGPLPREPPECRCGPVAEHGVRPARQHRRPPLTPPTHPSMSDRIDACVDRVKISVGDPSFDRAGAEPER
jgi:hypothetical protein